MSLLTCPFYSEDYSFSHRCTQKNRTHKLIEDGGPSPFPSPEGKGSDYRDTPIRRMCVSIYYLTGCLVGVTSHTTPLPAGEGLGEGPLSCGLKLCAKNLRELCVLCERKNSPASCLCVVSYSGCILFLTDEHRRTDFTKVHRDIKSTDITEPYSQF